MRAHRRAQRLLDAGDRGSVTLGRPAPMMIGAITTCSRSRQPAARKRDTVSAPPSIRMRRKPRRRAPPGWRPARCCPPASGKRHDLDRRLAAAFASPPAVTTSRRDAVVREQPRRRRQPAVGIDHHPRGARTGDPAHGQLRIVGKRGADPDHHRIDQRAQPMQVGEPGRAVDVVGMAGRRWRCGRRSTGRTGRPPPDRRPSCLVATAQKSSCQGAGSGAIGSPESLGTSAQDAPPQSVGMMLVLWLPATVAARKVASIASLTPSSRHLSDRFVIVP